MALIAACKINSDRFVGARSPRSSPGRGSRRKRDIMGKVRVSAFSVSLNGFAAGPGHGLQHPFFGGEDIVVRRVPEKEKFYAKSRAPGEGTRSDYNVERGAPAKT